MTATADELLEFWFGPPGTPPLAESTKWWKKDAAFDAEPRAFAESAAAAFVDLGLDPRRPWLRAA